MSRIAVVPCAVVDFAEMDYLMRGDGSTSAIPTNLERMQVAHVHCCPVSYQHLNLSQAMAAVLLPKSFPASTAPAHSSSLCDGD